MPAARPRRAASADRPRPAPIRVRARQQRGVRTEEAILGATLRMLARRGIHGMSLDRLALEVGVAKSSILWHFGSKEELLLRVAERAFEHIAQGPAREILALPTFEERGAATWRFYVDIVRQRPEVRRLALYLIFEAVEDHPELRERLRQLYRSVRALFAEGFRGVVTDLAQGRRLATLSVATLDGLFLQWLLDPDAIDLDALHEEWRALAAGTRQVQAGKRVR